MIYMVNLNNQLNSSILIDIVVNVMSNDQLAYCKAYKLEKMSTPKGQNEQTLYNAFPNFS